MTPLGRKDASRRRRLAAIAGAAVVVTAGAGCDLIPARRRIDPQLYPERARAVAPVSVRTGQPATAPRPAARVGGQGLELASYDGPTGPLPPLPDLTPVSDAEALAAPAATPMLDEALARAQHLRDLALSRPEPIAATTVVELPDLEPVPAAASPPPVPDRQPPAPPPAPAPAPPPPEDLWRIGVDRLRALAAEQADDPNRRGPWSDRLGVLDHLAVVDATGSPDLWEVVLARLAEPEAEQPAPEPETAPVAPPEPKPAGPRVVELRLCVEVKGFGDTVPAPPEAIGPGRPVLLYCEMDGVAYEAAEGGQFRSKLASRVELVPAGGGPPAWSRDLGAAEDLARRPRRDYYVNYRLDLPADLPPGPYTLRLVQADGVARAQAVGELAVELRHSY